MSFRNRVIGQSGRQVREMMDAPGVCRLAGSGRARREETTEEAALAELFEPIPPAFGIAAEPFEGPVELC